MFETITAFASAASRDKGTVSRDLKRPDWPISPQPPWDADDLIVYLDWVADRNSTGKGDPLRLAQIRKTNELAKKYLIENHIKSGALVSASGHRAECLRIVTEYRQRMLLVPAALGTLAEGKTREEVERLADEQIRSALDDIADRLGDTSDLDEMES